MGTKLKEFLDQVREIERRIEELELLREDFYFRIDEELEKEESGIVPISSND